MELDRLNRVQIWLTSLEEPMVVSWETREQILGRRVPVGMIFVPSVEGVSHSPAERTDRADLLAGAQMLMDTVLGLDERL